MRGSVPDSLEQALTARTDLDQYGSSKRLLFALQIAFGIEDIHTVATTALTDGPDDKKCDAVLVDQASARAVIAQSYEAATTTTRVAAPANKAADLNTAITWMLGQDLSDIPEHLRPAARELHEALEADEINTFEIWYCHNLPESKAVEEELQAATVTVRRLLNERFPRSNVESVVGSEVGRGTLETWYRGTQVPILVSDQFALQVSGCFEEAGDKWSAVCASVPAAWLHELFKEYQSDLFSANVREYLGSRKTTRNINNNIKETAREQPGRFWAYNNGMTALVNTYTIQDGGRQLTIDGIAIVNGAQTTGALGHVEADNIGNARVLARFVKCDDPAVIREIIRFNNSQNQIETADFRSNDNVQKRLRDEFAEMGDVAYSGARRGGAEDVIRRPGDNMIPSSTAAQALAAFHQEPDLAYNQKSRLWESDQLYGRFFSEDTTAAHLLFTYSLLRAIESAKRQLQAKEESQRTQSEQQRVDFFRQRGSTFLLLAAIGSCAEIYLDRVIPDPFRLHFGAGTTLAKAVELWSPMVAPALALSQSLTGALERNLRNRERVSEALTNFRSLFEATKAGNAELFASFARHVEVG